MNYQEQRPYVGNLRQLFGLRESRLAGGKADGVRIVDIHNGGDLALCVAAINFHHHAINRKRHITAVNAGFTVNPHEIVQHNLYQRR